MEVSASSTYGSRVLASICDERDNSGMHSRRRAAALTLTCTIAELAQGCASSHLPSATGVTPTRYADAKALRADISYLAGDRLEGRRTGTPGNDSAAAYIARRFAKLGLTALEPQY